MGPTPEAPWTVRLPRRVEPFEVPVTQEQITRGIPGDCHSCAISVAVRDYFQAMFPGRGYTVVTEAFTLNVNDTDGVDRVTYYHNGTSFISAYDAPGGRWRAQPFTLTLTPLLVY